MLDKLNEIVTGGHFILVGIVTLAVLLVVVMVGKNAFGRWWWNKDKKK